MDETELIARAQLRVFGRVGRLSRHQIERQFDALFDPPAQQQGVHVHGDQKTTPPRARRDEEPAG
jgi:hypothetical protein